MTKQEIIKVFEDAGAFSDKGKIFYDDNDYVITIMSIYRQSPNNLGSLIGAKELLQIIDQIVALTTVTDCKKEFIVQTMLFYSFYSAPFSTEDNIFPSVSITINFE